MLIAVSNTLLQKVIALGVHSSLFVLLRRWYVFLQFVCFGVSCVFVLLVYLVLRISYSIFFVIASKLRSLVNSVCCVCVFIFHSLLWIWFVCVFFCCAWCFFLRTQRMPTTRLFVFFFFFLLTAHCGRRPPTATYYTYRYIDHVSCYML